MDLTCRDWFVPVALIASVFAFGVAQASADPGDKRETHVAFSDLHASLAELPLSFRLGDVEHPSEGALELSLERFDVFAPDAELVVVDQKGQTRALPIPDVAYFSGTITGQPDSRVFLSVAGDGGITGLIQDDDGAMSVPEAAAGEATLRLRPVDLHSDEDRPPFTCDQEHLPVLNDAAALAEQAIAGEPAEVLAGTVYRARIAVETDHEYRQQFASSAAALAYIGELVGYASTIYRREVATQLQVSFSRLWETSGDPWAQTSSVCALYEFGKFWNDNMTAQSRTIAHMLSGKNAGGGVAWLNALCRAPLTIGGVSCPGLAPTSNYFGDYGYTGSIVGSFNSVSPTSVWDIVAFAHEVGHNFSSPHTHCYGGYGGSSSPVDQCYGQEGGTGCHNGAGVLPGPAGQGSGTIMGYCHLISPGMSNVALTFGGEPGIVHPYGVLPLRVPTRMRDFVVQTAGNSPSCLPVMSGFTVGGTVSGLNAGQTVKLRNTATYENLTRGSNGTFTFETIQATGASYNVIVQTQPGGQVCTVSNGSGTIGSGNVTNITINCGVNPCNSPQVIAAAGGTFTGTTSGASQLSSTGTCGDNGTGPEKVFQWTPNLTGTATITTCGGATNFDTILYMRSGSCTAGTQVACNDDTLTTCLRPSTIMPSVVAGQTYYIVVDGYGGAAGSFTLTVTPPTPPTHTPTFTHTFTPTPTTPPSGACSAANVANVGNANVNSGTAGTSLAVTVGAGGVPAGNSIMVGFTMDQTTGAVSCSDSAGNAYTVEIDRNNGNDLRTVMCAAYNVAALTAGQTVQVNHPNTSISRNMTVQRISGLAAAPLDRKTSDIGTGTAPSSGLTAVTTQADEVLYGVIGHRGNTVDFTAGANFTLAGASGSTTSTNRSTESEFRIVSATGQYAATGTLHPSRNWAAGIVTLKCGGGGPVNTHTPTFTHTYTPTPTPTPTFTGTTPPAGGCGAANVNTVGNANVNSGTAGTVLTVTVGAGGVPAGDSIMVGFTMNETVGAVSCGDSVGNAYTVEVDRNNGNDLRMVVCAAYNVAALAAGHTVQVTHPNTSISRNMTVQRISGLAAAPLDRKTSSIGTGTALSSGLTAVTTQADEVLYGVVGHRGNAVDFTVGAGFTQAGSSGSTTTTNRSTASEFRTVSAIGQYAATGTLNPSRAWAAGILTLKCGSGGTVTHTPTFTHTHTPTPTYTPTPTGTTPPVGPCNAASVTTVGTTNVNSGTAGTVMAVTVGAGGVPAGNSIMVGFTMNETVGAVSCSDSVGNAYTVEVDRNNGNDLRMVICAAYNVTALGNGDTVQVTHPSTSISRNMSVQRISGLTAAPLDRKASNIGQGTAPSSGLTAVTQQANEVLYGVIGHRGNTVDFSAGAGFTAIGAVGSVTTTNRSTSPEYRIVSSAGQYAATGVLNPSRAWAAGILTLRCN